MLILVPSGTIRATLLKFHTKMLFVTQRFGGPGVFNMNFERLFQVGLFSVKCAVGYTRRAVTEIIF